MNYTIAVKQTVYGKNSMDLSLSKTNLMLLIVGFVCCSSASHAEGRGCYEKEFIKSIDATNVYVDGDVSQIESFGQVASCRFRPKLNPCISIAVDRLDKFIRLINAEGEAKSYARALIQRLHMLIYNLETDINYKVEGAEGLFSKPKFSDARIRNENLKIDHQLFNAACALGTMNENKAIELMKGFHYE